MSLKGYEWLKDNKVIMYYTFKRRQLILLQNVSDKDYQDFKKYIINQGFTISSEEHNNYEIEQETKKDV